LLVKNRFKVLSHLGNDVIWPIKHKAIDECQMDIRNGNELTGAIITSIKGC